MSTQNRLTDDVMKSKFKQRLYDENFSPEFKAELAGKLGVNVATINMYISGTIFPKTKTLIDLAYKLGWSLNYLVGLSDVKSPDASVNAINEKTGLSQRAIEVLEFLNSEGYDADDRTAHRRIIDLVNLILEGCYDQIDAYKDHPDERGAVRCIFSDMMNYIDPGAESLSFRSKEGERTEIEGMFGTLMIGDTPTAYTINVLKQQMLINGIRKTLDKLADESKEGL